MQPGDWRKLLVMSLLIAGGRAADEVSTYLLDPKLGAEVNLFVTNVWMRLGLPWSWTMIAALETLFVAALVLGEWYYLRNYRSLFPTEPGYPFRRFALFCWYGRDVSVEQASRTVLPRKRPLVLGAYLLIALVIPTSYWAGANNLGLHYLIDPIIRADPVHARLHWAVGVFDVVQNVLLLVVPLGSLLVSLLWMHWRSYREYLTSAGPST